jgi:hypothetical protein
VAVTRFGVNAYSPGPGRGSALGQVGNVDWAPLRGLWWVADRAVMAVGVPLVVLGGYRIARGDEPPGWWLPVVMSLVLLSAAIRGLAEWRRRATPEKGS